MRLWYISLTYLDSKGLVALWREALLAKKVLQGNTKGYINHPQLNRFKATKYQLAEIDSYLMEIWYEADRRGYNFDGSKIGSQPMEVMDQPLMTVTQKQLEFEFQHLLKKLETRDPKRYNELKDLKEIEANFHFVVVPGEIEDWERT